MDASYPDPGYVNNSKERGPEESEKVKEGHVKEVMIQFLVGHPSQTFGPGFRQLLWYCLWAGTHLLILSPYGLDMTAVLVRLVQSPLSVPWSFV